MLSENSIATCKNEKIKAQEPPSFYINKEKTDLDEYLWTAGLDPNFAPEEGFIGELNAEKGNCNELEVIETSQKCGIGRSLMEHCLNDDDITEDGGINPLTDSLWEDEKLGPIARDLCKSIVKVDCAPKALTPKIVCKAYMDAARDA